MTLLVFILQISFALSSRLTDFVFSCLSLPWKNRLYSKTHYNKFQSKTNIWCKFHIHPSLGRLPVPKVRYGPKTLFRTTLKKPRDDIHNLMRFTLEFDFLSFHIYNINRANPSRTSLKNGHSRRSTIMFLLKENAG